MVRQVETAGGRDGVQLMIGQLRAERPPRSPAGTVETIAGIRQDVYKRQPLCSATGIPLSVSPIITWTDRSNSTFIFHVRYPTEPSRLIESSFCASTANSIGSLASTSRA